MRCMKTTKMLLPKKGIDISKWAVVACDQYTSEPEYWEEVEKIVGDAPSTFRLTLPEVYLEEEGVEARIAKVNETMDAYMKDGILVETAPGMMLVSRDTGHSCSRLGLVMEFDLEMYDYKLGSTSQIRPTEKTVVERIPPRLKVREKAPIELPHIMLLIDDPERSVIEPVFEKRAALEAAYDVELMQKGGHISGWFIPEGEVTEQVLNALDKLIDRETFNKKYELTEDLPLLPFATGDGNHSMATAKANWENVKKTLTPEEMENHPARFVLAEVVNIHDESLEIEAIYRVLFGADSEDVLKEAKAFFEAKGAAVSKEADADAQEFLYYVGDKEDRFYVKNSPYALPVASLQAFLDDYLSKHEGVKIDYIHGMDALKRLSAQDGNMGFFLPDPAKSDLFRGVILDGVLPRKTFSMGEAHEKRFYLEAKKIIK